MTRYTRLAGLFAAGMLLAAAPAAAQVRIIMSNDNNALGVKGQSFELLKAEIEKRLGSKVKVELHHSGTLFDQQSQIQGVQLGSAHIIAPGQGIYTPIAPKMNVLSLPFLLSSAEGADAVMKDPLIRATFDPDLDKRNITIIGTWLNGARDLSYRGSRPVLVPADLKGMKIRVQTVPVDVATMKALGANVVTMAWTEVPTAMQQGVIDAVEPVPNALVGAGLQDLISQTTKIAYQYTFYPVGTSKRWWNALAPDIRAGIEEALVVTSKWNWENTEKENEQAYDKVRALGKPIHSLTREQRALWVQAVQPVWKEFGDSAVGPQVMARLREIGEKYQQQ